MSYIYLGEITTLEGIFPVNTGSRVVTLSRRGFSFSEDIPLTFF